MPHESTVEHEISSKEYGPIENARRPTVSKDDKSSLHEDRPITEFHECDESEELKQKD